MVIFLEHVWNGSFGGGWGLFYVHFISGINFQYISVTFKMETGDENSEDRKRKLEKEYNHCKLF